MRTPLNRENCTAVALSLPLPLSVSLSRPVSHRPPAKSFSTLSLSRSQCRSYRVPVSMSIISPKEKPKAALPPHFFFEKPLASLFSPEGRRNSCAELVGNVPTSQHVTCRWNIYALRVTCWHREPVCVCVRALTILSPSLSLVSAYAVPYVVLYTKATRT